MLTPWAQKPGRRQIPQDIQEKVPTSLQCILGPSGECVGKESTPLELLMLGSLRYIGHGWTFDDLEESTDNSFICSLNGAAQAFMINTW
mmetsp:Transcript_22844/g.49849  ORF Transcript_22844/g.49849 Transcript_22844/m.49849 type:complete len:89 (+) Transcript_22844:2536-2802(+)